MSEDERSRTARAAAERALVRVVHHYGRTPEFVLLGGLVPDMLCSRSPMTHAGTTDVDVQVDLEIALGAVNMVRLEDALYQAEFRVDPHRIWRWRTTTDTGVADIKFELLADDPHQRPGATLRFDACRELGAANLPGTGYAARDFAPRQLKAYDSGVLRQVNVNVTGLAGFLLAKVAAAYGRRKPKDWYDIAFVLLHNDDSNDPSEIAHRIRAVFGSVTPSLNTMLVDLAGNFADNDSQGVSSYVDQMLIDHPGEDAGQLATDADLAVSGLVEALLAEPASNL